MKYFLTILVLYCYSSGLGQANGPWNRPLKIAWSTNGIQFNPSIVFQDSSGVPSAVAWKGDTLIAVFQWFRLPNPSPSWDRVATKFSYDGGQTWTNPVPIIIHGLPNNFQRPFDPTVCVLNKDSLRLYFSSSFGTPNGLDSSVNTYSAVSSDGINFYFEVNARVDELLNRVIDPAVIYFNSSWHYCSPIGSPQQGAYHYVSPNGLNFSSVPSIPSDNLHNWTGNYMVESNNALRFYGSGSTIWFNTSPNGGTWSGYIATNVQGGDPTVVKVDSASYMMIYVGEPYQAASTANLERKEMLQVYPNPCVGQLQVEVTPNLLYERYFIHDITGRLWLKGQWQEVHTHLNTSLLAPGTYTIQTQERNRYQIIFTKE